MSGTRAKHPLNLLRYGRRLSPQAGALYFVIGACAQIGDGEKRLCNGNECKLTKQYIL
jgi:hypothetical protein